MFNQDILADYPKIQALMGMLAERPAIQRVTAEQ